MTVLVENTVKVFVFVSVLQENLKPNKVTDLSGSFVRDHYREVNNVHVQIKVKESFICLHLVSHLVVEEFNLDAPTSLACQLMEKIADICSHITIILMSKIDFLPNVLVQVIALYINIKPKLNTLVIRLHPCQT